MAAQWLVASIAALASITGVSAQDHLVSRRGQTASIPSWDLQSSSSISSDLSSLSKPGAADTASWHHVPISKCTLMACLLEIGVYDDQDLWFSENLVDFNWGQFTVPWVYRNEFALQPERGSHFILQTNGITSRGDIYLNGKLVADKSFQSGSYAGHEYDITDLASETNALLIQAYPTNYYFDLAQGFIDWNPNPPDNGTGIWRDVTIKQTGPISLGPLRASVDIEPGNVTLRATARNLEDKRVKTTAVAIITEPDNGAESTLRQTITMEPGESKTIEFTKTFDDPKIWWPKQWGDQPLYSAQISVSVNCSLSDRVNGTFGLRTVTSKVNEDDDIIYTVNGHPFQVIGGGYSADMFLRFDTDRFEAIVRYMLDMGQNTIRLEGNNEQPELYEIADKYGLMVIAGWECCNKWESWKYNEELLINPPDYWDDADYSDANSSMRHDALMMQKHPSMLTFLIGSDFWPDDRATKIYVDALHDADWEIPIVASASKRGFPDLLGPSGMKMDGPYDWVPPNYWYDREPADDRLGAAFGFGSELGPGAGTPEIGSLRRFLTDSDMDDLWKNPDKNLYHMSTNASSFYNRAIYNRGLFNRYGKPTSLDDYLRKAQMMDYEATRAQYEAASSFWTTGRAATGVIYWMLVNAWPSLHWNQFDHYLHPAGTYFGTKTGSRIEHVSFNYQDRNVWLINHSLDQQGPRSIEIELLDLQGNVAATRIHDYETSPNSAGMVAPVPGLDDVEDVALLRLVLRGDGGRVLSRNVYWVAPTIDKLDWDNSTWYSTPVVEYVDYTSLFDVGDASVEAASSKADASGETHEITLENLSDLPAIFIRLNLVDRDGADVNPVIWSDNYLTLWPGEKLEVTVDNVDGTGAAVQIDGVNVPSTRITLSD